MIKTIGKVCAASVAAHLAGKGVRELGVPEWAHSGLSLVVFQFVMSR